MLEQSTANGGMEFMEEEEVDPVAPEPPAAATTDGGATERPGTDFSTAGESAWRFTQPGQEKT